jgi:hypothetical protein
MCAHSALLWICYKEETSQELLGKIIFKYLSINSKLLILVLNKFYRHSVDTFEKRVLSIMIHMGKNTFLRSQTLFSLDLAFVPKTLPNIGLNFELLRLLKERLENVSWTSRYIRREWKKTTKKSQKEESVSWLRFGFVIISICSKCAEPAVTSYHFNAAEVNHPPLKCL